MFTRGLALGERPLIFVLFWRLFCVAGPLLRLDARFFFRMIPQFLIVCQAAGQTLWFMERP
jgi:hypothetical protein